MIRLIAAVTLPVAPVVAPAVPGAPAAAPAGPTTVATALPAALPAAAAPLGLPVAAAVAPAPVPAPAAVPAGAAAPRGDLALLRELGSPEGAKALGDDLGGRAAFDNAAPPPGAPPSGEARRDWIWSQRILPSAYGTLPVSNGGWRNTLKAVKTFLTLGRTFDTNSDELPESRRHFKLLHPFGSVLKARYTARPGHDFSGVLAQMGVPGLIRLSLGAPEAGGTFIPGAALKLFAGEGESLNAVFLGEKTGVDGQQPDKDFFAQVFTNELPKPRTLATKLAAWVLGLFNHGNALRIPVDRFGAYTLRLKPAAGRSEASSTTRDFRDVLAEQKPGPFFEVWASAAPGAPLVHVGDIEAETSPVAARYGDQGLFFRHRR